MPRLFYILSRHKIPTLTAGTGDLVLEDIIDIASDCKTRVLDDENLVRAIKMREPELRFCYVVEVKELSL